MNVAIYARCSVAATGNGTIEAQLERGRAVVSERGWSEAGCFVDVGHTGTPATRPGMQALLAAIKRSEVGAIYAVSMSRFSRSMTDMTVLYEQCRAMDVQILTGD